MVKIKRRPGITIIVVLLVGVLLDLGKGVV